MNGFFKKIIFIFFLSVLLTPCYAEQPLLYDAKNLREIDGKTINMKAYKGKWVIINYWADWCGPCANEIPQLNAFYRAHQNKDAVIFAANYDQQPAKQLKETIKNMQIEYPSIIGNAAAELNLGDMRVVPATFIFAPDGRLAYKLFGEQTKRSLERKMDLQE